MSIIQNKDIYDSGQGNPFKAIEDALELLDTKIDNVKKSMIGFESALQKTNKTGSGSEAKILIDNTQKLATETDKLTRLQTARNKIDESAKQIMAQILVLDEKRSKNLAKAKLLQEQRNKTIKDEVKLSSELVGAYDKLSLRYQKAAKAAKDLAAQYGINSKEAKRAAENANLLGNQLKRIDVRVGQYQRFVGEYERGWKQAGATIKNVGIQILGAFGIMAGVDTIVNVFKNAFNKIKEFSLAVSELQALTGASGKDLDYLRDRAVKLGAQYGKSATEIVNAMKLVGSAKPELLENVSALSQMTESVLTLSKASGMELGETTSNLAVIMNQFGRSAAETNDTINILAAGSKFGAVEVDYLAQSISKVGSVAQSSNLTLEQTTAAMELFGEKGIQAEIAGTGFKSILVTLQKDSKNYTNGLFDLNKAIDNNTNISGDNLKLQKVFGKEYFNLAQILLQNKDRFNQLTTEVTGTNTAFEQASIATDNLSGDLEKAGGAYDRFILSLEKGDGILSKVIRSIVQVVTNLTNLQAVINSASISEGMAFFGGDNKTNEIIKQQALTISKITDEEVKKKYITDQLISQTQKMKIAEYKLETGRENGVKMGYIRRKQLEYEVQLHKKLIEQLNAYKTPITQGETGDVNTPITPSGKPKTKPSGNPETEIITIDDIMNQASKDREANLKEMEAESEAIRANEIASEQAQADEKLKIAQENEQAIWDMEMEYADRMQEKRDEQLKKEKEFNELRLNAISETMGMAGEMMGEMLAKGEFTMKEFSKVVLYAMIDFTDKIISMILVRILAEEVADKGFFGVATAALLGGLVKGAFAAAKSKVMQLATGTEYVQGQGTETSDSIPARLSKGERVVPAAINKQLMGISNKDLPQIINAGMNTLRIERLLNKVDENTSISAYYLSNLEVHHEDAKYKYYKDVKTGITHRIIKE